MRSLHTRTDIEAEIERLIGVLDLMDGEADDEAELGWPEDLRSRDAGAHDDREDEDDFEGGNFSEGVAWRGAFEPEKRFQQFRRYRHDRDYVGVSAEGRQ